MTVVKSEQSLGLFKIHYIIISLNAKWKIIVNGCIWAFEQGSKCGTTLI
jgi:hypothetical protein